MTPSAAIDITGLRFSHRSENAEQFLLSIQSLRIEPGETVACVGASGSGKTTLLHLIAGVLAPGAGVVRVLGTDLSSLSERQRRALRINRIGLVFQEFELVEYISARENISVAARLGARTDRRTLESRVDDLADATGIRRVLHRKPRELSQGERQRVALCRALSLAPELVLCDEPTGNLDPDSTERVLDLLLEQARASGATVLLATHNHGVLHRFDRVMDMAHFARPSAVGGSSGEGGNPTP